MPPSPRSVVLLVALLAACSAGQRPEAGPAPAPADQAVVLISLDGFRADYLDRPVATRLRELAHRGVRAEWMTPSFPSKTFPNHYTIVTGLYPEHHGIVANNVRDSLLGSFTMSDSDAVRDGRWWGGEPIWVTAELQGKRAANFFWPGSEAAIKGVRASTWMRFDDKFPNAPRVDSVLTWLSRPKGEAPSLVTLYFSDVDHAGHRYGPMAPETDSAIARVDSMVGRLMDGLAARGLANRVNVIVVSDHGMLATPANQLIALDDYISLDDVEVVDWSPVGAIVPKPGKLEAVYAKLHNANPHLQVYRKGEVPARFHFNDNPRITPLVLVADPGWSITYRGKVDSWSATSASHGWDNTIPAMRALFVAEGPAFRHGYVAPSFQNIHLYDLMCAILGLTPAPNDGSLDSTRAMLRTQASDAEEAAAARMLGHVKVLASDSFEGRGPGTRGDTLTVHYIQTELQRLGLTGGGPGGSWFQPVEMARILSRGSATLQRDGATTTFGELGSLVVAPGVDEARQVAGDMVFVGHGIVTLDHRWDDYKNVNVRGKLVVQLAGNPSGPEWDALSVSFPASLKMDAAVERGALGVITLTSDAVVRANLLRRNRQVTTLRTDSTSAPMLTSLLLDRGSSTGLLAPIGALDSLTAAARSKAFMPRAVPGTMTINYTPIVQHFVTHNVVAVVPGSDPVGRREYVLVSAHHDHLGRDTTLTGDQIFNGALDNAGGIAQFLEMARAAASNPARRSVLFLATAVEELGLLGAEWYVRHPLVPLRQTVGVVNLDFMAPWGRTRDVISIGDGMSTLDTLVRVAAAGQGRVMTRDPFPEQNFYVRSDHYAFAKAGIPGLFVGSGMDYIGKPAGWGKQRNDQYLARDYHRVTDAVAADWDLSGAVEDAALLSDVVRRLANDTNWPTWSDRPSTVSYRRALARIRGGR
ncbi:MAG: alkaline phosphatase family protein [Gemmatimonadota bacterium]